MANYGKHAGTAEHQNADEATQTGINDVKNKPAKKKRGGLKRSGLMLVCTLAVALIAWGTASALGIDASAQPQVADPIANQTATAAETNTTSSGKSTIAKYDGESSSSSTNTNVAPITAEVDNNIQSQSTSSSEDKEEEAAKEEEAKQEEPKAEQSAAAPAEEAQPAQAQPVEQQAPAAAAEPAPAAETTAPTTTYTTTETTPASDGGSWTEYYTWTEPGTTTSWSSGSGAAPENPNIIVNVNINGPHVTGTGSVSVKKGSSVLDVLANWCSQTGSSYATGSGGSITSIAIGGGNDTNGDGGNWSFSVGGNKGSNASSTKVGSNDTVTFNFG